MEVSGKILLFFFFIETALGLPNLGLAPYRGGEAWLDLPTVPGSSSHAGLVER